MRNPNHCVWLLLLAAGAETAGALRLGSSGDSAGINEIIGGLQSLKDKVLPPPSATPREIMYAMVKLDKEDLPPLYFCGMESAVQTKIPVAIYARDPEKLQRIFDNHAELPFLKNVRLEQYDLDKAEGPIGDWYKKEVERLNGTSPWKWAAEESNAWRTDLMQRKGGLYMDLDYFIINPENLIDMPLGTNLESWLHFRPNSKFMGYMAKHWAGRWEDYDAHGPDKRVWGTMGPKFLTDAAAKTALDLEVKKEGFHVFLGEQTANPMNLVLEVVPRKTNGPIHKEGSQHREVNQTFRAELDNAARKRFDEFQEVIYDAMPMYECDPVDNWEKGTSGLLNAKKLIAYHTWSNELLEEKVCSRSAFARLMQKACPTTTQTRARSSGWLFDG